MKWIATIASFCHGKRLGDVANPSTLKLPRVRSTPAINTLTVALRAGEAFAEMGKALLEIYDQPAQARRMDAGLDSNKVRNQERNEC